MLAVLFSALALGLLAAGEGVVNPHPEWRAPPEGLPRATRRDYVYIALMFALAVGAMFLGLLLRK
jgi:hypothetical protein